MPINVNVTDTLDVTHHFVFPAQPPAWLAPLLNAVFSAALTPLFQQFQEKIMAALDDAISAIAANVATLTTDAQGVADDVTALNATIVALTAQVAAGGATPAQIAALTDAQTQMAALHAQLQAALAQNPPPPPPPPPGP